MVQVRLGAVESLDPSLLVEGQHRAARRRFEVEPDAGFGLGAATNFHPCTGHHFVVRGSDPHDPIPLSASVC
jgi:hypothetical protein